MESGSTTVATSRPAKTKDACGLRGRSPPNCTHRAFSEALWAHTYYSLNRNLRTSPGASLSIPDFHISAAEQLKVTGGWVTGKLWGQFKPSVIKTGQQKALHSRHPPFSYLNVHSSFCFQIYIFRKTDLDGSRVSVEIHASASWINFLIYPWVPFPPLESPSRRDAKGISPTAKGQPGGLWGGGGALGRRFCFPIIDTIDPTKKDR